MSIYHKDKCTKEEAFVFKQQVKAFLESEKLSYTKVLALCSYGGEVRVYTGEMNNRLPLRQRRRLLAFRNPDGTYEGDKRAIQDLKANGGTQLWLRHSEPIETKDYTSVYRCDNWEEEKQALKENLIKSK